MATHQAGIRRRSRGTGFSYIGSSGPLSEEDRERIAELVIPPAWKQVWISEDSQSRIQAMGTDDAGRRQYIYLSEWTQQQEKKKFVRAAKLGLSLPRLRASVRKDLASEDNHTRALAAAVRLLDKTAIRIGGDDYAVHNGSFGLTTLRCRHVEINGNSIRLQFRGKSGKPWDSLTTDAPLATALAGAAERGPNSRFLVYKEGRRWHPLHAQAVNGYLSQLTDGEFSAKDFRTWKGTLVAGKALAAKREDPTEEAVRGAVEKVAKALSNTVAVARGSYIDPLLIETYLEGELPAQARSENGLAAYLDKLH